MSEDWILECPKWHRYNSTQMQDWKKLFILLFGHCCQTESWGSSPDICTKSSDRSTGCENKAQVRDESGDPSWQYMHKDWITHSTETKPISKSMSGCFSICCSLVAAQWITMLEYQAHVKFKFQFNYHYPTQDWIRKLKMLSLYATHKNKHYINE